MEHGLILAVFLIDLCSSLSTGCPHLWYEYGGSCYRLFDGVYQYNVALSTCQGYSSLLTIISDAAEDQFINELFSVQEGVIGNDLKTAFIGLVRSSQNTSTFVWIDGTPLIYQAWGKFEPNNYYGDENCVIKIGPSTSEVGLWYDINPYLGDSCICEKKLADYLPTTLVNIIRATYLNRLPIAVFGVRSSRECFQTCLRRINCVSCNFLAGAQRNENVCVLNAATIKEQYAVVIGPGSSYYGQDVANWIYMQLILPTDA